MNLRGSHKTIQNQPKSDFQENKIFFIDQISNPNFICDFNVFKSFICRIKKLNIHYLIFACPNVR